VAKVRTQNFLPGGGGEGVAADFEAISNLCFILKFKL
jgi:hypothetical protein